MRITNWYTNRLTRKAIKRRGRSQLPINLKSPVFLGLALLVMLATKVSAASYTPIGKGCTSAYAIDADCDGFGVGSGYVNGPDADDINPSVNTTASVEALYGTITNGSDVLANIKRFLAARLAGSYSSVVNIYFIAPNGSDSTGIVNDIAKPYATAQGVVSAGLSAGDLLCIEVVYMIDPRIN